MEQCSSSGSKSCQNCLSIAEGAYADGELRKNPDLAFSLAKALAENAGLRTLLESQPDIENQSCAMRTAKAHTIGKQASLRESYITDDNRE